MKWAQIFENNDINGAAELLNDFNSTVDYPANTFGPLWLTKFPNAKLILTERSSADEWYESASKTILPSSDMSGFKDLFDRLKENL